MRFSLEVILDRPAEVVWDAVLRPATFQFVARPFVEFVPVEKSGFPDRWIAGDYRVRMDLFGLIPMGKQRIGISLDDSKAGEGEYRLRDDGGSALISKWDHRITVRALDETRTCYRDEVEIRAGLLTPCVWLFARMFFAHRQRRWKTFVAMNGPTGGETV
jgi:ligand-binding SRPBCC domain-containing protein